MLTKWFARATLCYFHLDLLLNHFVSMPKNGTRALSFVKHGPHKVSLTPPTLFARIQTPHSGPSSSFGESKSTASNSLDALTHMPYHLLSHDRVTHSSSSGCAPLRKKAERATEGECGAFRKLFHLKHDNRTPSFRVGVIVRDLETKKHNWVVKVRVPRNMFAGEGTRQAHDDRRRLLCHHSSPSPSLHGLSVPTVQLDGCEPFKKEAVHNSCTRQLKAYLKTPIIRTGARARVH